MKAAHSKQPRFFIVDVRCASIQRAQGGNNQRTNAPYATAVALGGAGDQGCVAHTIPVIATSDTSAQRPVRSRAALERRWSQTPPASRLPSRRNVPAIEFQS